MSHPQSVRSLPESIDLSPYHVRPHMCFECGGKGETYSGFSVNGNGKGEVTHFGKSRCYRCNGVGFVIELKPRHEAVE